MDLMGFPHYWFHKKKRVHLKPVVVKAVRDLIEFFARKAVKKIDDRAFDSLEAEVIVDLESQKLKRVLEKRYKLGGVVRKRFFLFRPLYWFKLVSEETLPDYAERFFKKRVAQLVLEKRIKQLRKRFRRRE